MTESLCIIGFGRLGETLAQVLKPHFSVAVYEIDEVRAKQAQICGFDTITTKQLADYRTVILCVPISTFKTVVEDIATHLSPGTLVMDTCSVKVHPVEVMEGVLPDTISIIATHPLFGPDSIGKGFENLTMVTYPVRVADEAYAKWDTFWKNLGLSVLTITPSKHDRTTAITLGMTHFFGRIMGELKLEPHTITTAGYNALYEVMQQTNRDTWQLFHDMQCYNPYAKEMRDRVYEAIWTVENRLDQAVLDNPK